MEQHRDVLLSQEQVDRGNLSSEGLKKNSLRVILFFPQAISCLKKALWLCPLNFNVLYNLGVVLMTAQQFASAFQCFVSAVSVRPESAESFMMLASA